MADVVLKFVVENLLAIIKETWKLIGGAKEDCAQLLEEVDSLKAFLEDAAHYRQSNSKQWKHFVNKVQVIVYKAEDLIDKLHIQAKQHQEKYRVLTNYAKTVKECVINIKAVLDKVKKIREENQHAFQAKPMLHFQQEIVAHGSQKETLLEETEVVGFDEETETVIKRLVEGTDDLDAIPVVGLPGLGKTTLALKIYKDSQISYHFYTTIWIKVGLQYKLTEVFLSILKVFAKLTKEHQDMNVNDLAKIIREFISKGGKCLIVLDDVWEPNVVHAIKEAFPKNKKGHRIMITTRDASVARYANAHPHSLKFLKDEESFQLLENRVFGSNIRCPEELIARGKSIAKQCSGVPLAVVVIAGALRGRTSERWWQMVKDNVGNHLINKDDPESCLKYVEMSYIHLPEKMKACFLYCGAFPQGFEIPAWKLIRLWISEGLINSELNATLEEMAEQYLNELINRNLVMVMQKRVDGLVKTCRIHDMLHQFCKMEAKSEGFFQEVCEKTDQPGLSIPDLDTSRRLLIQLPLLEAFISKEPFAEHVRSFLCFSKKHKGSEQLSDIRLLHKAFPLVRVLDIESLDFSFSNLFKELYHLRYIAISGNCASLPAFVGKFWNLQTLILNTKASTIEIKADIWNMLQLRHLHTNVPAKLTSPATQTTYGSSCLQTLSKVAPGSCGEDVLLRACNLKKVSIQGEMAEFLETNKGGFRNFAKLKFLEHLKLLNDFGRSMRKVVQLPPAFAEYLQKLNKLTLSHTKFPWSDANILARLECLEVLKLKENAFSGTTWDLDIGGCFSQLKVLFIQRADFEIWKASDLSFQRLKCLVLISCDKLEVVPFELAGVSSLQQMTLENTNKAIKSAKAIECRKRELIQESKKRKFGMDISQAPDSSKFKLMIFPPETSDCNAI
ncbi:putative late blight resistance protein homolog R1A-3 [Nicotiana sylvestris]